LGWPIRLPYGVDMADEYRVEVELKDAQHELTFWERLRSLDLDDHARKRLGGRVTITRDGSQMFMYASTEQDAREAEKTMRELVADDDLDADYSQTRWNAETQSWNSPDGIPAQSEGDEPVGIPDPRFELLETYKPEFLRDLGL
jgi:hypothetical protein